MQKIIKSEYKVRKNSEKYISERLSYLKDVWDLSDIDI